MGFGIAQGTAARSFQLIGFVLVESLVRRSQATLGSQGPTKGKTLLLLVQQHAFCPMVTLVTPVAVCPFCAAVCSCEPRLCFGFVFLFVVRYGCAGPGLAVTLRDRRRAPRPVLAPVPKRLEQANKRVSVFGGTSPLSAFVGSVGPIFAKTDLSSCQCVVN